ncbi:unnamed protein product [Gulo gulo]|uniref:Uncharacterized protein n=1 Tax=Gulo gulo TaxID=48420 RepID=A0A9X9LIK8_GULGU|nr:unnamed protein product [Gulo gulo]
MSSQVPQDYSFPVEAALNHLINIYPQESTLTFFSGLLLFLPRRYGSGGHGHFCEMAKEKGKGSQHFSKMQNQRGSGTIFQDVQSQPRISGVKPWTPRKLP